MSKPESKPLEAVLGAILLGALAIAGVLLFRGNRTPPPEDPKVVAARQLVAQWADKLDKQTTDTGVYVRWPNDTLPDDDPWGRPLRVAYSQGGVAEDVTVRSLGPDGEDHTPDDVLAIRHAMNLKGIGEGVKKNAEETSKNAAKGVVKGLVEGAKESLRGKKDEEKSK